MMVTLDNIFAAVRKNGIGKQNYWLYIKKDGSMAWAKDEEEKSEDSIGYFVEDDSKLKSVFTAAKKRINK